MNKKELVVKISENCRRTQQDTRKLVNAFFETISQRLAENEMVEIPCFGKFEVKMHGGRKIPTFKPSRDLRIIIEYDI